MKTHKKIPVLWLVLPLLIACSPSATVPSPTKESVPFTSASAEQEIIPFMVDVIIQQEIRGDADYVQTSDLSWVEAAQNLILIIHQPTVDEPNPNTSFYFKDKPTRVWLYGDNKLAEPTDIEQTLQKYEKDLPIVFFGIYSTSTDYKKAKVLVEGACGPSCRHLDYYIIERNAAGGWEVIETENIWIT
jgi:hypothetical protein